ncbi:MAG: WYL domain-containing transcriptional regulator [Bacteroidales bacterium]|nr:WYL domain-containing transcriptional regulator [Bacteroidales bacterium]
MPEMPQLERLLRMLINLSSGVKYTAGDLSERYGISRRTFFRDKQTLLNAGFAVEHQDGLYWIDKIESPFRELHQLPYFTEEEAWIMRRAIHSIDENNQLKTNLVEKLYSLYKFGKVAEIIVRKQQSEVVSNLTKAISHQQQVILREYHSSHGNTILDRTVEPFDFTSNFIAVWAFDTSDQTCKTFKISRISQVTITGEPFRFARQHHSLPLDVFRISGTMQTNVKLKLSLRSCNLLTEEYPLAEKYITPLDNNLWLFDAPVSSFEGVGRFALGLCNDVEILEPEGLKAFIRGKISCIENHLR